MDIRSFFRKPKILSKFLIFGCILSVVPVVIFSLFCYVSVTRQITANVDMVEEKLLSSTQAVIEKKLSRIDQSIYELSVLPSTVESLQLSVFKYNWTTFSNVNGLRRRINETQALIEKENITANITLISELGGWVLDSSGFFQKEVQRVQPILDLASRAQYPDESLVKTKLGTIVLGQDDNLYMIRTVNNSSAAVFGIFVVEIPKNQLFDASCQESGAENLLVLDHVGEQVSFFLSSEPDSPVLDNTEFLTRYHGYFEQPKGEHFTASISGKKWSITRLSSDYVEWQFCSFTPYGQLHLESTFFTATLLAIAISIIFVALYSLNAFTTRIYRPMEELIASVRRQDSPGEGIVEDAACDEFSVLSHYMDSMRESNQLLETMLGEQKGQVENLFFLNLLDGRISEQQIEDRCCFLSLPANEKWFFLSLYKIENSTDSDFRMMDTDLILFAVKNIADELFSNQKILFSSIRGNGFLILHRSASPISQAARAETEKMCNELLHMVLCTLHIQLAAGISDPYGNLSGTHLAFLHAREALKYPSNASGGSVRFYDGIDKQIQSQFLFPKQTLDSLMAALKARDGEKCTMLLHDYIDLLFRQPVPYGEFEYAMAKLMITVSEFLREKEISAGTESPKPPELSELLQLGYSRDVEAWLLSKLIHPALAIQAEHPKASVAQQVSEIIHQEYNTPLTLEYCASKIGYHPSYVSRIFRQQMGYSFKEYLYLYRIEQAKRLLAQSNMKIQEISNHLCYNNPQNFIRVFKKVEGVTPGEYRMEAQKKKEAVT
jgi:AraC-like DNA-binding protein